MEDETTLRIEQAKLAFQTVERLTNLRARRHLAVLAVVLAAFVSVLAAGLAGQLPWFAVGGLATALGGAFVEQLRALERLWEELAVAGRRANDALESLIVQGGQADADAQVPFHG